ncbi:hypothetical protein ID866_4849 [Astraeus odoratus]|nr:hypothetical protein ID866_4849 [Astraeus odoratus]
MAYTDAEQGRAPSHSALEAYERDAGDKPPFYLTYAEIKLLGIAGVGFFLDAYDLFIINPVATMLQYRLYGGASLPNNLQGLLKAAANIGSVIGQFFFEAERYENAKNMTSEEEDDLKDSKGDVKVSSSGQDSLQIDEHVERKAHFKEFVEYFSEWRHAKILIGTCTCWFLLDIAFYGINLNQNVVLQTIGYDGSTGTAWEKLFKISTGNIIITALGFVPGYYVSVLTIEKLGRKVIQIQGFFMTALFLGILAGKFTALSKPSFIVCFAFLQFFFNFGPNTTTYCYPAEVFPTKYRASAHGISAACGKAGAIISALVFNTLTSKIGTPAVLWIFFGCSLLGAGFTLLLPEVAGRDPDVILAEELREKRLPRRQ